MAQPNNLQSFTTPAEVSLPCRSSLDCQSLPWSWWGWRDSHQHSPEPPAISWQQQSQQRCTSAQGKGRERTEVWELHVAPMGQMDGKAPGREAPAHAPATPTGSSPFPAKNWHIFICKDRSWAGGTHRRMGTSVWWLSAKPPAQRSKETSYQGDACVGKGCLGQQSPEAVAKLWSELWLASREAISACP